MSAAIVCKMQFLRLVLIADFQVDGFRDAETRSVPSDTTFNSNAAVAACKDLGSLPQGGQTSKKLERRG